MKEIYTFKFWKHKYGPELLVDIVDYAVMLPPIRRHPTFTETVSSQVQSPPLFGMHHGILLRWLRKLRTLQGCRVGRPEQYLGSRINARRLVR